MKQPSCGEVRSVEMRNVSGIFTTTGRAATSAAPGVLLLKGMYGACIMSSALDRIGAGWLMYFRVSIILRRERERERERERDFFLFILKFLFFVFVPPSSVQPSGIRTC